MYDLAAATAATTRDFDSIISRLDALPDSDWQAPVRCAGWRVADLAAHVVGASRGQAEGLRRAAAGISEVPPLDPPAAHDPQALLAAMKDGKDQLVSALRGLPEAALDGFTPLPFGLLPTAVALQIIPLEYGFHRNDLDWALGDQVPLGEDIAATLLEIAPGLLPILAAGSPVGAAGTAPDAPVSVVLRAPGTDLAVSFADGAWTIPVQDVTEAACTIEGDDSSLALFIMGRVDAGYSGITATDAGIAAAFKRYFPGP